MTTHPTRLTGFNRFTAVAFALSILGAAFLGPTASAASARPSDEPSPLWPNVLTGPTYDWGVGFDSGFYRYEEPGIMQNEGGMYGIDTYFRYKPNRWHVKAEFRASFGRIDYSSVRTGESENNDNTNYETRFTGGYEFFLADNWTLTPYFGIGYRYLKDDQAGKVTSTGHLGYERESHYLYSPIGVELWWDLQNTWKIGLIGEYDIFWNGKQESNLSTAIPAFGDVDNNQDSGYGLRGSIPFVKDMGGWDLVIEPYVRYWKIDDSDVANLVFAGIAVGYGLEPKNETFEAGAKIAVVF